MWKHFGFHAIEGEGQVQLSQDYANIAKLPLNLLATPQTSRITWTKKGTFVDHKSFARQPTIAQCVGAQTKLGFHSTKAIEITTAIGKHVILDMKPLSSVEPKSFRNILAKAGPRFTVPSRTYYKDTFIPKLYEAKKLEIIKEIKAAVGNVSIITTDCWTSHATESYMTVTAHFVNNEYELKSYILQTRELD